MAENLPARREPTGRRCGQGFRPNQIVSALRVPDLSRDITFHEKFHRREQRARGLGSTRLNSRSVARAIINRALSADWLA